jgi:hypothetical protein
MSRRSVSVGSLYSFDFRLQKTAMRSFIARRKFSKHAIFSQRKKKIHRLLSSLRRRTRYVGSRRKQRKDS